MIVLASDHGELLGSHGLYCKNIGGFEEVYQIPMVVSGPGIYEGLVSEARVGLHDLAPTLLELAGEETIGDPDSRSFAATLKDAKGSVGTFTRGFAEYHGGRYRLTQRVVWDGPWKLCLNGFDFDELYNLDDDPYEMTNLIDRPEPRRHCAIVDASLLVGDQGYRGCGDVEFALSGAAVGRRLGLIS